MKFTSEDLLKATGLELGQIIKLEYPNRFTSYKTIKTHGSFIRLQNIKDVTNTLHIDTLLDREFEIIQPNPTLTEDEKVILRNLPKEWKWITRDVNNYLYLSNFKPLKIEEIGYWEINEPNGRFQELIYDNLFKFIKLEDEPYSIEELLGEDNANTTD